MDFDRFMSDQSAWPDFAAAPTYAEATALLASQIRAIGFSDFNYGCVNYRDSLASTMDPEWIKKYLASDYWRSDPLVVVARQRVAPFLISEIFAPPPKSTREVEMREAIAPHPRGIVVPIHCPHVGASVAAFLTPMTDEELAPIAFKAMACLTVLSLRFHDSVTRFYKFGPSTDLQRSLTEREREILGLSASGKNSAEIGQILGISEATVNNHMGRILKKMNVSSRSQAVALAMQIGQISRSN